VAADRDFEGVVQTYDDSIQGLGIERTELARRWTNTTDPEARQIVLGDAKTVIHRTILDSVFPAWAGTPWAFYGASEGIYIVGLDYHVGFLVYDGDAVQMCHSSVLWPGTVLCEPAAKAEAMHSMVHVVGPVLTDDVLRRWVQGKAFPTWSG
jgi:hypothetical protein